MKKYLMLSIVLVFLFGCDDPYKDNTYQAYDLYPAATYLESRSADFSEWIEILNYADLYNAVNQASKTFTLFVPDNTAVEAFYAQKGVDSIDELGKEYAQALVKFHTLSAAIEEKDFLIGGKLTTPTTSGDYLTVSFDDTEGSDGGLQSIYINDEARVTELSNEVTNGYIYVLNAVLTPLVETIYDRLNQSSSYSIFKQAVEMTGWDDRLKTTYDTIISELGTRDIVKKNFTLFVVPDQVYSGDGINDVNALITRLGAGADYENDDNALRQYVSYHLISQTKYVEDLFPYPEIDSTLIWTTQAAKQVLSTHTLEGNLYINYNPETSDGVELVSGQTDIPAKNGVLHEVGNYMPVFSPDPLTVVWDLCDYDDVESVVNASGAENDLGDCYQQYQTTEYQFSLTGDAVTSYTWNAYSSASSSSWRSVGYLLTKANSGATVNTYGAYKNDMLVINLGYLGNISMNSPVLLKGKYKVELYYACAGSLSDFINGGSLCKVSLDDTSSEVYVYDGAKASVGIYSMTLFDEINFDETDQHEFKLVLLDSRATTHSYYRLQLDYIKFIPVQ